MTLDRGGKNWGGEKDGEVCREEVIGRVRMRKREEQ